MRALLLIALSLLWSGTMLCRAETITIALTSTSSAEVIEEDAPSSIVVSYQQKGGNGKGWFIANAVADLSLTGIAGTISSILVNMKSNKSAGAGQVSLTLGTQSLLSFSGSFADWMHTGYSTTYLPFAAIGTWRIDVGDVLQLHIAATENSIYLGQVEIEYTPDPPVIQCAEFRWLEQQSLRREVVCETVADEGVIAPEVNENDRVIKRNGQTYHFMGWTNLPAESTATAPYTFLPHQRCYPTSSQEVLFALYKLQTGNEILTDNDLTDGEYALALKTSMGTMALAAGRVSGGVVPVSIAPLQRSAAGIAIWNTNAVEDELRYRITVNGDSLTLYHPASDSYLGYNNSGSLSPNERAWAWQAIGKGTIVLYHNGTNTSGKRGLMLKESISAFEIAEKPILWSEESEHLFVFPLADVPTTATPVSYTTFPSLTPLVETSYEPATRKEWVNGQIIIRTARGKYNLLGMPLD